MDTVKLYRCTCTAGVYSDDTQGTNYSLEPWGNDTLEIKGYDDGGQDYRLPDGYTVRETISGQHMIYNADMQYCSLVTVHNAPAISDINKAGYIFLKKIDAETERLYGEYERENGLSIQDGKTYWLTQPAYAIGDGTHYEAKAVDLEGNEYLLTWETTEEWDEREDCDKGDESEACDWNALCLIIKL